MNKNTLLLINVLLVILDLFVGLHLVLGLWGNILLNHATELYTQAIVTTLLIVLANWYVLKLNRKAKKNDQQNTDVVA